MLLLLGAAAKPMLVPDVSQRSVEIYYSFSGAELLLFGAIIYPDGRPPKEPADIVVILKGPSQSITMREKQKIAGMWINAAKIGRASCRERVCQYVEISVVAVSLKKENRTIK